ncbi:MAG: hypothetical protein VX699_04305, partial [Myxococcota bacterium]|nr:hypothetical protein [Myxococcota bacterium]
KNAEFTKDGVLEIVELGHQRSLEKLDDVAGWYDFYGREVDDPEAEFERAYANPDEEGVLHLTTRYDTEWELSDPSLLRVFAIIQAQRSPGSSLAEEDQGVLAALQQELGEGGSLRFDRASVELVVEKLQERERENYRQRAEVFERFPTDPIEIRLYARDLLSRMQDMDKLRASSSVADFAVWGDEGIRSALHIIANEVDKPDFNVPGTDDDVPRWFFDRGERVPDYTLENIEGLVNAMRDFSGSQGNGRIGRVADRYSLQLDEAAKPAAQLKSMEAQLTERVKDYDAIGFAVKALRSRMDQGLGRSSNDTISQVGGDLEGELVGGDLAGTVREHLNKAHAAAGHRDWRRAEREVALLGASLNEVYVLYGESGLRDVDFEHLITVLDEVAAGAQEDREWSTLDIIYSVLTLGFWALRKGAFSKGSGATIERADALRAKIEDFSGAGAISDMQALRQLRETVKRQVMPQVKDAQGREFMSFFVNYLDAAIYREMQNELTAQLTEQVKHLEQGGGSSSVSFEVGAGWGLPGAAKLGAGVGVTLAMKGADDRRVREGTSVKLTLEGSGTTGIATLKGKLGASAKAGKTFKSTNDFIQYHRDDILGLLMRRSGEAGDNLKAHRSLKRATELNGLTKSQMDRFRKSAHMMGLIGPHDAFRVDPNRKPVPTRTLTLGASGSASEEIGFKPVKLGFGQKLSSAKTTFFKRVDYLEYLKSNLDLLDTVEAPDDARNIAIPAKPRYEPMAEFKERVRSTEGRANRVEAIMDAMNGLHAEFTQYCQLTRHRDSLRTKFSRWMGSPMEKEIQKIKQNFQGERGLLHRGDYIHACILTHANLLAMLHDECTPEELAEVDLTHFDKAYTFPRIEMTEKQIHKLKKGVEKVGTTSEVAFSVDASVGWGLKGEVAATISQIKNNANPDNDGLYLTLSMQATADVQKVLGEMVSQLEGIDPAQMVSARTMGPAVTNALMTQVTTGAEAGAPFNLGLTGDMVGKVDLVFIKNPKLHLQYVRVTGSTTVGGTVEDVPIFLGGLFKAGVKESEERLIGERLGNNTLSYIQGQFNGFKLAGGEWEDNWVAWCNDGGDFKRKQLWKLGKNLGDEKRNVRREFDELAEGLKGAEKQKASDVLEFVKQFTDNPDTVGTQEQMDAFAHLMAAFFVATKGKQDLNRAKLLKKGWKPLK